MAKQIITIKVEVNDDKEAYFLVNKLSQLNWLENIKVKEATYKGKTTTFTATKKPKHFLKGKITKD